RRRHRAPRTLPSDQPQPSSRARGAPCPTYRSLEAPYLLECPVWAFATNAVAFLCSKRQRFSRRDCYRLRPAQLLALRPGIPCMLLTNFPTGCLVANACSSPRSLRAPVQGLIELATVAGRWNVDTELGHATADLVDQAIAAGTVGIVGETHCNGGP